MSEKINNKNEKPIPPSDSECCESGCSPCVWDYYYADLKIWREEQRDAERK